MISARREILLWTVSAVAVLAAHGGIVAALSSWSDPDDPGGAASAVMIEMAPIAAESASEYANLPIAPLQEEQTEPEPTPEVQEPVETVEPDPVPEQKLVEVKPAQEVPLSLPPTPLVTADVTLPPEAPKQVHKPPPKKKVAVASAPERAERVAPRQRAAETGAGGASLKALQSYGANILRPHIQRRLPSARLNGVVTVTFTITRQGRLVARRILKSSGNPELDSLALSTLQRAQPYPPPPPELAHQSTFNFNLPLRYN